MGRRCEGVEGSQWGGRAGKYGMGVGFAAKIVRPRPAGDGQWLVGHCFVASGPSMRINPLIERNRANVLSKMVAAKRLKPKPLDGKMGSAYSAR